MRNNEYPTRKLIDLTIHPLLKNSPMLASDHPDCQNIRRSIEEDGFTQPVLVNERDEIVDGRHRVREAIALGIEEAPVQVCQDKDASQFITRSVLARRHLAKWQMAYCLADILQVESDGGVKVRCANLKRGRDMGEPPKRQFEAFGKTLEFLGISPETWQRVNRVRRVLLEQPELRAKYEPRMFSAGEDALSLEGVAKALPSIELYADEVRRPNLSEARRQYDTLAAQWLKKATLQLAGNWDKMTAKQRANATLAVSDTVVTWPAEVRVAIREALKEAGR